MVNWLWKNKTWECSFKEGFCTSGWSWSQLKEKKGKYVDLKRSVLTLGTVRGRFERKL